MYSSSIDLQGTTFSENEFHALTFRQVKEFNSTMLHTLIRTEKQTYCWSTVFITVFVTVQRYCRENGYTGWAKKNCTPNSWQ